MLTPIVRHEDRSAQSTAEAVIDALHVMISEFENLIEPIEFILMMMNSHCPWVWNCSTYQYSSSLRKTLSAYLVGVNNHRQFLIFVTTLVTGIILFDYLAWACEYRC